jgi:hypothetical protein
MPYNFEETPHIERDETVPESDEERMTRIHQAIIVSARQLLYAFESAEELARQHTELHRMYEKTQQLETLSRAAREAHALRILSWVNEDPPFRGRGPHETASSALKRHFVIRGRIEQTLRPLTDTGKVAVQIGRHTAGLFYNPQK